MNTFRTLFLEMFRLHRGRITLAFFLAFVSAGGLSGGLLALAAPLQILLDPSGQSNLQTVLKEQSYATYLPDNLLQLVPTDTWDGVLVLFASLLVLTAIGSLANYGHQALVLSVCVRSASRLRSLVFTRLMGLDLAQLQKLGAIEAVSRITRDASALQKGFQVLIGKSVTQIARGIGAFCAALFIDWKLAALAILVAPPITVGLRFVGKRVRLNTSKSLEAQQRLNRVATESLQGLRAIKVAQAESWIVQRFETQNQILRVHGRRVALVSALASPVTETLAIYSLVGILLLAAQQVMKGALGLDEFLLVLACLGASGASLRPLAGLYAEIQSAMPSADRLTSLMDLPQEVQTGRDVGPLRHSLAFKGIHFTYQGRTEPAVHDVSFTVNFGKNVAIIGPNGCGKTTLVSLIPRLLDPHQGAIQIDGVDTATVCLRSIRSQISMVTQDSVLIRGTIRENVDFGQNASLEQIQHSLSLAEAEFVYDLPDGLNTQVAEGGVSLSGGQRQRLAIARAILRNPSILILDEATSQIDSESEAEIGRTMQAFGKDRTVLVVAHRPATILAADEVVVMDQGRIVDQGTNAELQIRCSLYRALVGQAD